MKLNRPEDSMVSIPAVFFDRYMPDASGEFVKIFLYLFRRSILPEASLSVTDAADALNHTEADILRALRYWERMGLLDITWESGNNPSSCRFIFPDTAPLQTAVQAAVQTTAQTTVQAESAVPSAAEGSSDLPASPGTDGGREEPQAPAQAAKPAAPRKQVSMTELAEDDAFSGIVFVAQHLLGKVLSPTETEQLGYWYRLYPERPEIIEFLIEYCADQGHPRFSYMEKVLLNWHTMGFSSLGQVQQYVRSNSGRVHTVMKEFGLQDRKPGSRELAYITRWYQEYGFDDEMVALACSKTLSAIQKPSFEYADRILSGWKEQGIRDRKAAEEADNQHRQQAVQAAAKRQEARPAKTAADRFHRFEQRDTDYDALDDALLYGGEG